MKSVADRAQQYAEAYHIYPRVGPTLVTVLAQVQVDLIDALPWPLRLFVRYFV